MIQVRWMGPFMFTVRQALCFSAEDIKQIWNKMKWFLNCWHCAMNLLEAEVKNSGVTKYTINLQSILLIYICSSYLWRCLLLNFICIDYTVTDGLLILYVLHGSFSGHLWSNPTASKTGQETTKPSLRNNVNEKI